MTLMETTFMQAVPNILQDIVYELKKMNKLKALELKGKAGRGFDVSIEQIDDIMEGR